MSKRKVTHQQGRRIKQIQAERRRRAKRSSTLSDEELATQSLGPEQTGLLITRFGSRVAVENQAGELVPCHLRQHLADPVAGDHVIWREGQDKTGVVVAIEPRQSELVRLDRDSQLKPIAANISQMFIVLTTEPAASLIQLDKFLIGAHLLNIKPHIILNKSDLTAASELQQQIQQIYQPLGYPILSVSTKQQQDLPTLLTVLQGETSIFVGQSGVGKSSLVQALLPQTSISVGELSEQSGLGAHTTTATRLYHLPQGGDIIDSPGVRQFSLWSINLQQLLSGYPEFTPYLNECHFRNCQHHHETQCAIKTAVQTSHIHPTRYEHYLNLLPNALTP